MAKNLSTRTAERVAVKKPSRNAQNRATFLALRGDIKQALDDGWPVKTIWETLHEEGKVEFSYQAFRGYVNRLILSQPAAKDGPKTEKIPEKTQGKTQEKNTGISGFSYDPSPDKKDLL